MRQVCGCTLLSAALVAGLVAAAPALGGTNEVELRILHAENYQGGEAWGWSLDTDSWGPGTSYEPGVVSAMLTFPGAPAPQEMEVWTGGDGSLETSYWESRHLGEGVVYTSFDAMAADLVGSWSLTLTDNVGQIGSVSFSITKISAEMFPACANIIVPVDGSSTSSIRPTASWGYNLDPNRPAPQVLIVDLESDNTSYDQGEEYFDLDPENPVSWVSSTQPTYDLIPGGDYRLILTTGIEYTEMVSTDWQFAGIFDGSDVSEDCLIGLGGISFANFTQVPEPASLGLIALGSLALLARKR